MWKWRGTYSAVELADLDDAASSGRLTQIDDEHIVTATLTPPPQKYGVTHRPSHLLADHMSIGNATVAQAWRKYGVQP